MDTLKVYISQKHFVTSHARFGSKNCSCNHKDSAFLSYESYLQCADTILIDYLVHSCGCVMIFNPTIKYHPEDSF